MKSRKCLIITHYPFATPRVTSLAKYLPDYGWQPVFLTPPFPNLTSTQAENPDTKIVTTGYRDGLAFWKNLFNIRADEHDIREQIK
jgi:hypothetical protein